MITEGLARWAALAVGAMISLGSQAQVPADAPTGTTSRCKDGSYYSGPTEKGACAEHGGVKDWYGAPDAKPAAAPPAPAATPSKIGNTTPAKARKRLEGLSQVWVDTSSKVYYCSGAKEFGKSKNGEYMIEADAKAAGNHADDGKPCS